MADGSLSDQLGDCIASLVEDAYQRLSPACKPVIRSNGLKEWTVLAGVVAVSTDRSSEDSRLRLISIGTGVKALPDGLLARSQGRMVHDCHAEILALRGFNTVLLEHIRFLNKQTHHETDLLERSLDGGYCLKAQWELALYVSALPCGDASMEVLRKAGRAEMDQHMEAVFQENDQIQWIDARIRTIVRGRFNYHKLGVVRTKPGRCDSQVTYSKSCSDKLCISQVTSVLNSLTWELMKNPVYLRYLVIPNDSNHEALRRSFQGRLDSMNYRPLEFLTFNKSFSDVKSDSNDDPSSMSCVKAFVNIRNAATIEHAILNGVRNGFYTKGNKPLRKNCEPVVSRIAQWRLFIEIRPELAKTTYLAFKATQEERNKLIRDARKQLSADGWIKTCEDDCSL